MEVVLEIGEEARPKPCSSEIGSAKQPDESAEKTLGDDSTLENGVRVSENGEQKILGDVDEGDNKSKENVVVEEKLNGSGVIEDCMMNGVSSLLKLKQDVSDKDNEDEDEDVAEDEDGDGEEEDDDEEHGYCVGDFVWGKIKNHPWWPGQIYDSSDASDLALKIKQNGKLLVAYFGDGTFAWCGPSQLKPFAESFNECSTVSNSKSFLVAVNEAVEEMGRHIECLLICDCADEKNKFVNPEAKNAGIKEGVLVRDVRREMISSLVVGKPEGILKDVKSFAETVSFNGLLELEVFKRKVSAFYRSQRGYGLTEYPEPQSVPGLEDKNNDDDDDDDEEDVNIDDGIKWRAKRSSIEVEEKEEEEAIDPGGSSVQRSLEKCSGFPDHRQQHRRKQKSIAEILENESAAMVRFETEPSDGDVKSGRKKGSATTPRRRRMSKLSAIEDKKVGENGNVETLSRKKKKKRSDVDDDGGSEDGEESAHVEEIVKDEVSDPETDIDSTPLASLRKKVRVDASSVEKNTEIGETTATLTSKRERKKSKYFAPEFLSDFSSRGRKKSKVESESSKASSQSQAGDHQMTDASNSLAIVVTEEDNRLVVPGEPTLELDNGLGHQELSEELSNAVEFLRLGATPMEMRELIRVAALGIQYPKDSSSRDMVREFMSIYRSFTYHEGANRKLLGSYSSSGKETEELTETGKPETHGKERKDKKRKAKQQTEEIGKEENETNKKERKPKKLKSKKQGDEEEETQQEASESAKKERKPKKPKSKKQGDEEEETGKEARESTKKERKPKKPKANKQAVEEEETQKESSEPRKKERKPKKPKHKEAETRKESMEIEKPEEKEREGKSEKKQSEKEFSGAELFVTFGPGSSLPKKEELIDIYGKFGALDEERTFYTDLCARVAFLNVADGEKAFESSLEKCPFAHTSKIKFRLKYPNERAEEKKPEAEVAEKTMEVEYVKKKLDVMRSLVGVSEGGITADVKVKLEDEIVNLLEKVRKMKSS
uniref:Serine/threonine-protein kinase ATM n=1 Tax=Noccaea caerulescens TaxID=107243 RepID=A0A1J3HRQ1_NOCCA